MTSNLITLDSIGNYNQLFGYPTINKDITVIDSCTSTKRNNHYKALYDIYAIFLKTGGMCSMLYGQQKYDYKKGTAVCFNPGKEVIVDYDDNAIPPSAFGLLFSKDFIKNTVIEKTISKYHFLSYFPKEALHLSDEEFSQLKTLMSEIQGLLSHDIPLNTKNKILTLINKILKDIHNYYNRQFNSRKPYHHEIVLKFQKLLDEYFATNKPLTVGLPYVSYFADQVFLSSGYFGDLIKKETGMSAQRIIQNKLIEKAKDYLDGDDLTITEIADLLGFQYPQHFSRMFKKITGLSPKNYRSLKDSEIQ